MSGQGEFDALAHRLDTAHLASVDIEATAVPVDAVQPPDEFVELVRLNEQLKACRLATLAVDEKLKSECVRIAVQLSPIKVGQILRALVTQYGRNERKVMQYMRVMGMHMAFYGDDRPRQKGGGWRLVLKARRCNPAGQVLTGISTVENLLCRDTLLDKEDGLYGSFGQNCYRPVEEMGDEVTP